MTAKASSPASETATPGPDVRGPVELRAAIMHRLAQLLDMEPSAADLLALAKVWRLLIQDVANAGSAESADGEPPVRLPDDIDVILPLVAPAPKPEPHQPLPSEPPSPHRPPPGPWADAFVGSRIG